MKKLAKLLSLVMALMLAVVSVFTGCSNNTQTSSTGGSSADGEPSTEPITLLDAG